MLTEKLDQPFSISYTPYTLRCMFTFTIAYVLGIGIYYSQKKNYRRGVEHGSAKWGDAASICKRYRDKRYTQNLILTQNFRMGLDCYKHKRNLNVLVVGGSGAGKSRAYAVVNIMQCNCSMVVTDPKGELLRKTGGLLEREGYEVRVFDLINPETSFCYNPFAYVRDDKDVLKLINNLIRNTTPKGAQSSDPFWEKSETALLQALMLYLLHEAPPEEQNFSMIMEMLGSAQVKEDDEEYQSPLDILFERLEMRNPESIAVKQYAIYKQAAGKTAKSILISVGVRLAAFNLKQIANLTCTDELDLYSIGEKKVALFCCIPDADTSLNYLVGMIYSNLFQTLYYVADRKYHGKLPIPVHCIMDEWPNVALPDDFDKLLATMRSRAISCSIIIQNIAQMKALFKDSWESLIGNCDEFLYLGGNEKEGHKYVSELLGKETLDINTYGQTKGRSGSYSVNFQQSGRELLTPDEVRLLDNRKAVLLVRGERPILDDIIVERAQKLIIFIDELDRCRPSFAIEMLERIKHYFDDERVIFVVSLNKEQLIHTITNYYGSGFDATRYLNKFFDVNINLPVMDRYQKQSIEFSEQRTERKYWLHQLAEELSDYYHLSLRDKLIYKSRIESVPSSTGTYISSESYFISLFVACIILLDIIDIPEKKKFLEGKSTFVANVLPELKAYQRFVNRLIGDGNSTVEESQFQSNCEEVVKVYKYAFETESDEYYERFEISRELKQKCIAASNGHKYY